MNWKRRTIDELANMISVGREQGQGFFVYRSSSYITEFFRNVDTDYTHDGTTRNTWIGSTLVEILDEPHPDVKTPPETFCRVVRVLMERNDAQNEGPEREGALKALNI